MMGHWFGRLSHCYRVWMDERWIGCVIFLFVHPSLGFCMHMSISVHLYMCLILHKPVCLCVQVEKNTKYKAKPILTWSNHSNHLAQAHKITWIHPHTPTLLLQTQHNQNTTWLCWYFDWTFEASGRWRYKWREVDNVNTLWLDRACWVAKGQGGAHCWLFSKDSPLKFVW